jgi:5'-3' exonuclease
MHPSSLISYYPTYAILDEIVSIGSFKELNIFIDLKNVLQTTYMKHAIENIVESSKSSKFVDTAIFSSLISFLSFHKIYGVKRGIETNFIVFFESGHSYYHKNIDKNYKVSRKIDDLYGLDKKDKDLFYKTLQANFQLIEKACNKLPRVRVVRLPNLEADFVPYYILKRNLVKRGEGIGNIIYSNDHDLWQCLQSDVVIFSKAGKTKKIVKQGNVLSMLFKKETNIPDDCLTLAMSVIGDPGDDVTGVKGIGPAKFLEIFEQLISMIGTMNQLYDNVENNRPIFNFIPKSIQNKHLRKVVDEEVANNIISKNLKLVSFELISRALDNPSTTEMIDKRKIIEDVFSTERETSTVEGMKRGLEMLGVFLEEASLDFLYI